MPQRITRVTSSLVGSKTNISRAVSHSESLEMFSLSGPEHDFAQSSEVTKVTHPLQYTFSTGIELNIE